MGRIAELPGKAGVDDHHDLLAFACQLIGQLKQRSVRHVLAVMGDEAPAIELRPAVSAENDRVPVARLSSGAQCRHCCINLGVRSVGVGQDLRLHTAKRLVRLPLKHSCHSFGVVDAALAGGV